MFNGHVDNRFDQWGEETVNFFRGRNLKVYFCVSYLCSNELIGYV